MSFDVGDRIRGYTATGKAVEGAVVRIGATALLLDTGTYVSKASAVLVEAPERQQLTVFDALKDGEVGSREWGDGEEIPPPPLSSKTRLEIAHQQRRIAVYQEFIDTLTEASRRYWEAAMTDAEELAKWKAYRFQVIQWSQAKLKRLQGEARAEIKRLRGEKG